MTRREWLALISAAPALGFKDAPTAPVAVSKCPSYDEDLTALLAPMFDRIGGLDGLVRGKTVTIKLNMTGSPGLRFQGLPLGVTHYSHPKMVASVAHLLGQAGARRIRFVESAWGTGGPLNEYMLDSGWNVRSLMRAASGIEFENTNAIGSYRDYARVKSASGHIYPAFDLNRAYHDTDVFVSMAKLKNHETCGVTLALKNCFGITPASIYGDDAGRDEPNENPSKGRLDVCHLGKRQPSRNAPGELDPSSSREQGYRVPRITVDLVSARPIDLSIVDGIETMAGGEGPWIQGIRMVKPGVVIVGANPVATDAVATAIMGYSPRATRGTAPFTNCDNTMLLAEAAGIGTTDLNRIEVRGVSIADAMYRF
ncbi:MAG: DUF362 domain-containing protein [Bryobacteraceae bacterium]|nr:DUF362 domain-containing protein [Bryobacteraceae bacterium]